MIMNEKEDEVEDVEEAYRHCLPSRRLAVSDFVFLAPPSPVL